jgi:hypothetical protein
MDSTDGDGAMTLDVKSAREQECRAAIYLAQFSTPKCRCRTSDEHVGRVQLGAALDEVEALRARVEAKGKMLDLVEENKYWLTEEVLGRAQQHAFRECECVPCPECRLMPKECTNTECANTCQCSDCVSCRIDDAVLFINGIECVDRVDSEKAHAGHDPRDVEIQALRSKLAEAEQRPLRTMDQRCAEMLADEVDALVRGKVIDSRHPAADALLDFRNNKPSTDRSDALVERDAEIARLSAVISALSSMALS